MITGHPAGMVARFYGGPITGKFDSMAARKPQSRPANAKVAVQVNLPPDVALKLKLAAVGLNCDISEVVARLVIKEFGGVHLRGLNSGSDTGAGQGGVTEPDQPTVKIPGPINRISAIHARASKPIDDAIEDLGGND